MATALTITLGLLVVTLAVFATSGFEALWRGCGELRRELRATSQRFDSVLLKSPIVPGVSMVLAPADSSPAAFALARRLLNLHFGKFEVVLVLAGQPLDPWIKEFHLVRREREVSGDLPAAPVRGYYVSRDPMRLMVVDQEANGIAGALNAGVNAAQYPVIGLADEEAEFIPELLLRLVRPLLAGAGRAVAVCGVAVAEPLPGLAGHIAVLESLRTWLGRCAAFSAWNRLLPVPGCCVLVKREALRRVGGFRAGALELFVDLHRESRAHGLQWNVAFLPAPVSVRAAAGKWLDLWRHAGREQREFARVLHHPGGARGAGLAGVRFRELRPLLETAAWLLAFGGWLAGIVPGALAALVPVVSIGGGMVNSMAAVVLRERAEPSGMSPGGLARLFLAAVPENLGYRQVRNLRLSAVLLQQRLGASRG